MTFHYSTGMVVLQEITMKSMQHGASGRNRSFYGGKLFDSIKLHDHTDGYIGKVFPSSISREKMVVVPQLAF